MVVVVRGVAVGVIGVGEIVIVGVQVIVGVRVIVGVGVIVAVAATMLTETNPPKKVPVLSTMRQYPE